MIWPISGCQQQPIVAEHQLQNPVRVFLLFSEQLPGNRVIDSDNLCGATESDQSTVRGDISGEDDVRLAAHSEEFFARDDLPACDEARLTASASSGYQNSAISRESQSKHISGKLHDLLQ